MSERTNSKCRARLGDIFNLADQLLPASTDEHTDPQQADVVQEGRGPAGEEPDRVQELFRLLKRALEEQTDPAAVARTFRARQDAQLVETRQDRARPDEDRTIRMFLIWAVIDRPSNKKIWHAAKVHISSLSGDRQHVGRGQGPGHRRAELSSQTGCATDGGRR